MLAGGFIVERNEPPFCINPLTVAENKNKLRLVLDLKHVNSFLNVPKFKYKGLPNFADMVEKRDFAVKFDLTSGYHHISIHKQHCEYLGFKWKFADGAEKYYVF